MRGIIGAIVPVSEFLLKENVVTVPPELRKKIDSVLRRLLSDRDGEIIAAVLALKRLTDIHAIAAHIEAPVITKEEMDKIFESGRAQGIEDARRRQEEEIRALPAADETDW